MNPPAPSNSGSPLKLPHRDPLEAATGPSEEAVRRELAEEFEALREREANLREYEARLRAWQAQLDSRTGGVGGPGSEAPFVQSVSQLPFSSDSLLASSWEKFHKARAILEAEQKQMRDERMMMRDTDAALKRREMELAAREEQLKRERLTASTDAASEAAAIDAENKRPKSAMERLTSAPFRAARSAFKSDK